MLGEQVNKMFSNLEGSKVDLRVVVFQVISDTNEYIQTYKDKEECKGIE